MNDAAKASFSDAVKALLQAGAQADVQDNEGRTPLHEAAKRYSLDTVKALLGAGAQADRCTRHRRPDHPKDGFTICGIRDYVTARNWD